MQLILAADKDPHARRLIAEFLAQQGYRVEVALDGAAAWDQTLLLRPALLISAILLPKVDGLALCRQIKSAPQLNNTAVLICSILAASARAMEAGADGFLSKPLSKERLLQAVARLLPTAGPDPRTSQ